MHLGLCCLYSFLKIGGAFAPPLKDLCRFLQENPEYGVPPEWADVVKQSVSYRVTLPSHIIKFIPYKI